MGCAKKGAYMLYAAGFPRFHQPGRGKKPQMLQSLGFIVGTNDSLKAIAYIYLRPFSLLYLRRITEDVLACKSVLIVYGLV